MIRLLVILVVVLQASEASAQLFRSRSRVVVAQPVAQPVCQNGVCSVPVVQQVQAAPIVHAAPVVQAPVIQAAPILHSAQIAAPNLIGIPVPVQYNQPVAAQGNTVYGYQAITNYQNGVDLGALYNQAARLTDQAQQLAGQAATDFQSLVQAEGQYKADVARIIAQGQAAREALSAVNVPQRVVENRTFSFKVTATSDGQIKVDEIKDNPDFDLLTPKQSANSAADASSILSAKCVKCHNDNKSMGGLNLLKPITQAQQQDILNRVVTDDMSLLMPRSADNKPGPKLSNKEISTLYQALKAN